MPLTSILFKQCQRLQACAVRDPDHVTPGARGEHVARLQKALNLLDDAGLDLDGIYGPATAAAVLAYKRKRHIINPSYQTAPDNIVGIKTIAAMDRELNAYPRPPLPVGVQRCTRLSPYTAGKGRKG
jgi:peptidoglycan hydrolase-like protein with peptidoglycan-binding domain